MLKANRQKFVSIVAAVLFLAGALAASAAEERQLARVKKQADGTVSFKQIAGYTGYDSDDEYHAKLQNLTDPQAIAELKAKHHQLVITDELNGGILNGQIEIGNSVVTFELTGGGSLEGFHHTITMPASFEVHSAPHHPGTEIDTFKTNMYRIEGTARGDGVFESVRLVGGTGNGYPSPGQMSIISKGDDEVLVDSFFNVGFRLEITGAAGGPLAGVQDAVIGSVTMRAHADKGTVTGKPAQPDSPEAGKPDQRQH